MIGLFTTLMVLKIIRMGSCELNANKSDTPVANINETESGQAPKQSPDMFFYRPAKPRIIGGKETDIKNFPFMVSVTIFHVHMCGGSYIRTGWVLSAANCLIYGSRLDEMLKVKSLIVNMGSTERMGEDMQTRKVEMTFIHENFNLTTGINDIGLLKLERPFDVGPSINMVVLDTTNRSLENMMCSVVGWGATNEEINSTKAPSIKLMKINLPIVNKNDCEKYFNERDISKLIKEDGIICAGMVKGKDTCLGDAGGPLMCDNVQVGIVSLGIGCGGKFPGVYTKVFHYNEWINIVIEVTPKVKCTPETMRIEIPTSSATKEVYLEGLRDYPDPACRSRRDPTGSLTILELSLEDVYRCAVMRITNNFTGKQMYYQTVVIENNISVNGSTQPSKEILHVKCSVSGYEHAIEKRNVLPAGFQEEEELEITTTLTKIAPEPILGVGVRHEGNLITGDLNVSPKTPLQMEIFLDKISAPVYGLLVTHMQVTDTKSQEETIIYNGCSIDTYLFENFNTVDGDFLTAKFRAFKFPDSSYVQFKGTVNVCLDRCKGVECSAGQIGYGRRKREIPPLPADPNKVFEITITSFIKINNNDDEFGDIETRNRTKYFKPKELAVANQLSDKMAYALVNQPSNLKLKELTEEESYTSIFAENVSTSHRLETVVLILAILRLFL